MSKINNKYSTIIRVLLQIRPYLPTIIFTRWSSGAHPLPDGSRSGTACTALTTKAHWGGACRWQACHNMSGW